MLANRARHVGRVVADRLGFGSALDAYLEERRPFSLRRNDQDMRHLKLLMPFWLRADSNCIDVGANAGEVLREMVSLAPDGMHLAFEPIPDLAARLRSEYPGVDVRQVALADEKGTAAFMHVPGAPPLSGLKVADRPGRDWDHEADEITVQVDRLDDCLPAGYAPDFVKIDVEGAERDVIAGGLETFRAHRPIIVFELMKNPGPVWSMLEGVGYEILDTDGGGPHSVTEAEELCGTTLWQWVARPRG